MSISHLIQVGAMGAIGRFASVDSHEYSRGVRVICRTSRGLEVGQVLAVEESASDSIDAVDGQLLRKVTVEDDLLIARLERHKHAAYDACCDLLAQRGLSAVLMEVEALFDGSSIFFYFFGEVTPEIDALTAELAAEYEANVQFRKFGEMLTTGCGPDCGTEAAAGCSTGGCSTCSIASACAKK